MIEYDVPRRWMRYEKQALTGELVEAKAAISALRVAPYQREWVDRLQTAELKREISGTLRAGGVELAERDLEKALDESPEDTDSGPEKQAHAAAQTYRWLATIPDDRPIDNELILEIHHRLVTGVDDDQCGPGILRKEDQAITFGTPSHQGAQGGRACTVSFSALVRALRREFRDHDEVLRAFAAHYHLGAMHPFLDGNGRTARAVEALMLQRAGLRDVAFVAMSNYYCNEKSGYFKTLNETRQGGHDLTAFFKFALRGVALQAGNLLGEITGEVSKVLYRDLARNLFSRVRTNRQQLIANRQIELLTTLLDDGPLTLEQLLKLTYPHFKDLKNPRSALGRDLSTLLDLKAIGYREKGEGEYLLWARLEWPTEASIAEYLRCLRSMPKPRIHSTFT